MADPKKKKALGPVTGIEDLGKTVRDRVTGITGTAFQYSRMLSGTEQVAIQPRGDGATMPEGRFIDVQTLEVLDDGLRSTLPPPEKFLFNTGDEVEDRVSGMRGLVIAVSTFINGCAYLTVQCRANRKGEVPEHFFHQERFKLVKAARLVEQPVRANPAAEEIGPRPGGPMRAVPRANG